MTALWVALLGAAGSLARWGLSAAVGRATGDRFPWGTFAVNLLGAVAIGAVMGLLATNARARIPIVAGFLGGFTTYSSFAWETWALIDRRAYALAAGYVALTTLACLAGCAAGALVVDRVR